VVELSLARAKVPRDRRLMTPVIFILKVSIDELLF
jgi:hypothetical protein